jgi:glycine betaine/proline transport system permease protein
MQTLAMVVIASLIGASGLGHNLLLSLNSLKMGQALEQGVAITVIAIGLDRISQALAEKKPVHVDRHAPIWQKRPHLIACLVFLGASLLLAALIPALHALPEHWTITTAPFWDAIVRWISTTLYDPLQAFRNFALLYLLIPLRNAFLWLPWLAAIAFIGVLGWQIGGFRLALLVASLAAFPAVTGFWQPAMVTLYMIGSAIVICVLIGFPLGLWASRNDRIAALMMTVCDTLQTFPSFIYLIPVVMLFKTSDVAAITAVIAYATVPMIRYTNLGLRAVPVATKEAAIASGCTGRQLLWKVELPIALPQIMLGLNQTIMMALFMVAITALIGTKDLGQEINKARSDADAGRALTAGLCIAFLGIIADRLISGWSRRRQRELALA